MLTLTDNQVRSLEKILLTIRTEAGTRQRRMRIINYADKARVIINTAKRKHEPVTQESA